MQRLLAAVRAASPLTTAASASLRRLFLSTGSPARFVAEDYLVTTCGLTPTQAVKSARYLAHLKSPAKPDAVLAFLADVGLEKAHVAAAVTKYPLLLCAKVGKTLTPRVAQLRSIGFSVPQISCLVAVVPGILNSPGKVSRMVFYLSFLGSFEKLHTVLKRDTYLLSQDIERLLKPKIALLHQCGLTDRDIIKMFLLSPRMFRSKQERIEEIVACADKLGVRRHSPTFKYALMSIFFITPENIGARSDFLKKALGCSEAELGIAVLRMPNVLNFTEGRLSRAVDFLKMEIGLDTNYIVHRPALLKYSMKRRLIPRHHVLKALKEKGLVKKDIDFFCVICQSEKTFSERFLHPYKGSVPGLACTGPEQVPPET